MGNIKKDKTKLPMNMALDSCCLTILELGSEREDGVEFK